MASALKDDLLSYLLKRLGRPSPWRVTGGELARFPKRRLMEYVGCGLLRRLTDLDEYGPCDCASINCVKIVSQAGGKIFAVCPQALVPPQKLSETDVSLYEIDGHSLCRLIRQANSVEGPEITTLGRDMYFVGEKVYGPEKLSIVFLCRLTKLNLKLSHSEIRNEIKGGRIVCLTPSPPTIDLDEARRLRDDRIFVCPIDEFQKRSESLLLQDDAILEMLRPASEQMATPVLDITEKSHIVKFKGQSLTFNKMAFDLLVMLAIEAKTKSGYVRREDIDKTFWPSGSVQDSRINDLVREVRNMFAQVIKNKKELTKIIKTKSRVGYKLNIPPDEIIIL